MEKKHSTHGNSHYSHGHSSHSSHSHIHSHHNQYIALSLTKDRDSATSSRPKYTTRHLAALDFLLHIPMAKEMQIRKIGMENAFRLQQMEDDDIHEEIIEGKENYRDNAENPTRIVPGAVSAGISSPEELLASQMEFAGKKLQGPHAQVAKYPPQFRYYLQRLTDQSALCRQWEDKLLNKSQANAPDNSRDSDLSASSVGLFTSRLFFSRLRSYPVMVASIIKYDAGEEKAKMELRKAEDQKGMEVFDLPQRDWRGFSYKPLFKQLQEERAGDYFFEKGFLYDPYGLDDPSMLYGSHRYVLQRSASTGPILSSIILYVNKKELKETLNEQFRDRHPNLPPSLTLSKIRKVKKEVLALGLKLGLELSTIAVGLINFERLCLKSIVTKYNRKLSMAVSLLLAFKFNESSLDSDTRYRKMLDQLFDFFDQEWDLPKKEIFDAEFGAFVHLGFALHLPYQHVHSMFMSLLKIVNKTSLGYLGEDMQDVYVGDIMNLEREIEHIAAEKERELLETEEREKAELAAAEATERDAGRDHERDEEDNEDEGSLGPVGTDEAALTSILKEQQGRRRKVSSVSTISSGGFSEDTESSPHTSPTAFGGSGANRGRGGGRDRDNSTSSFDSAWSDRLTGATSSEKGKHFLPSFKIFEHSRRMRKTKSMVAQKSTLATVIEDSAAESVSAVGPHAPTTHAAAAAASAAPVAAGDSAAGSLASKKSSNVGLRLSAVPMFRRPQSSSMAAVTSSIPQETSQAETMAQSVTMAVASPATEDATVEAENIA